MPKVVAMLNIEETVRVGDNLTYKAQVLVSTVFTG